MLLPAEDDYCLQIKPGRWPAEFQSLIKSALFSKLIIGKFLLWEGLLWHGEGGNEHLSSPPRQQAQPFILLL